LPVNNPEGTKIEGAFRPLRCVAEIWDYNEKLRFKVFDKNNKGIVERPRIILREIRDKKMLEMLLQSVRYIIERKGFKLDPL